MPEAEYFSELPVALRGEIVLALAGRAVGQSYMFRQLSREVKGRGGDDPWPLPFCERPASALPAQPPWLVGTVY